MPWLVVPSGCKATTLPVQSKRVRLKPLPPSLPVDKKTRSRSGWYTTPARDQELPPPSAHAGAPGRPKCPSYELHVPLKTCCEPLIKLMMVIDPGLGP